SLQTILRLIDLVVESRSSELNQVHFPAELGPRYVEASEEAIHEAVKEFLRQAGPDKRTFPAREDKKKKGKKGKKGTGKAGKKQQKKKPVVEANRKGG